MSARILVVDDIPANVRLLEAKLAAEYFEVVSAASGKEALELIDKQIPDIVLLDVMMPEMDGFEVCARIRANPKTHFLPVVMVTALSDPSDRVRGLEAGADDFLTKPVNDLALFARVRSLVRLKMIMDEWRMREQTSGAFDLLGTNEPEINEDRNASVLLVEGFAPAAQRVVQVLSKDGDTVEVTDNLARAQELAAHTRYDLIITNIQVGGEDGLRLCSHLRSQEETRQVPILLIVEEFDMPRLIKGLDIGASDYLMKPIDPNELLARVRIQVRRRRYQDRLRTNYERSLSLALTDSLTGLYNRRYAMRHLDGLMDRVKESGKALSVLVCDLDRFKNVNDSYGHAAGDEVLKEFAGRIRSTVRGADLACRFGGEEFVVVMPYTPAEMAASVAERLRGMIEARPFQLRSGETPLMLTASMGIATLGPGVDTPEQLLKQADRALYEAKNSGPNRVVAAAA